MSSSSSGRALLLRALNRLSAAGGGGPSCSGRPSSSVGSAAAAAAGGRATGPRSAGCRLVTTATSPGWSLRPQGSTLWVNGPLPRRHLASAPEFAPASVASAAATADQPTAPSSTPPPPAPSAPVVLSHPLDYTTMCALAAALRSVALPAKVDEVVQVDSHTACLRVRVEGEAPTTDGAAAADDDDDAPPPLETLWLWLCWHNQGARITVGPPPPRGGPAEAYGFGRSLESALGGAVLVQVRCPLEYERCVELLFSGSASAPADTALVLYANSSDNYLALVNVEVRSESAEAKQARAEARLAAQQKPKGDVPPGLPVRKAPRSNVKAVKLPADPARLVYGRVLAASAARPSKSTDKARKKAASAGRPPLFEFPVPGDYFKRPKITARHMMPSFSETASLWRSNVMAADAEGMAFRAAEAAAAVEEVEEEEDEEVPPPTAPSPTRRPKLPDSAVAACIARTYAGVGRATADEVCVAAGVDPSSPPSTLTDAAWSALHAAWNRWLVSVAASSYKVGPGLFGRPYSVLAGGDLLQGGPLDEKDPLAQAAVVGARALADDDPIAVLPTMARADALELMATVDTFFRQVKDAAAPTTLEAHVRTGTSRALRRAQDKVNSLSKQADRATSADAKSHTADLVMANVHAVPAGATEVTVDDWETGEAVTIPLGDGRTPPPDVAAALYKEARRLRRGAGAVAPLLEAAQADVAELEAAAEKLAALPALGADGEAADAAAADARTAVLQEVRAAMEAKGWLPPWREAGLEARGHALAKRAAKRAGSGSGAAPKPATFRRFTAPSGLEVLVGRNNRTNDQLSLRVANPGDTWLHARGVPGAHVVLRAPPGGESDASTSPDEADLRFAAAIAAFFSKAREGGLVDVSYTPAKNVKKPRGAPAGMVNLLSESVVRARPDEVAGVVMDAGENEDESD